MRMAEGGRRCDGIEEKRRMCRWRERGGGRERRKRCDGNGVGEKKRKTQPSAEIQ